MSEIVRFTFFASFLTLSGFMGGTIYLPAFPQMEADFHVPPTLIKFSLTTYFIGLIIGNLLTSPLVELYGRRKVLTTFLFLTILSSLMCALAPSIPWLLWGRLGQGIGNVGGPIIITAAIASKYKGHTYYKTLSFVLIMIALGPGVAPILGSILLELSDWRILFFVLAGLNLLSWVMMATNDLGKLHKQRKLIPLQEVNEYLFFFKHPLFPYYWTMIGTLYGGIYVFAVSSPYIFLIDYGWSTLHFSWIGLGIAIGNSLGTYLNELFIEKIGSRKTLLIGLGGMAAALIFLFGKGSSPHPVWFLLFVTLFMVGGNLTSSCLTALAVQINPHLTDMASSLVNLAKVTLVMLILILVLFVPEDVKTVNLFLLGVFIICFFGYLKIMKKE